MKFLKYLSAGVLAVTLAACGGGGGSADGTGSSISSNGTSSAGNTQTTAVGSMSLELVNGAGLSTNSLSAIEIGQVRVIVKNPAGALVSGTIVSFSESGVGLLKFAPASQTAMTTSQGLAVMEVRAADQSKTGATTISVTATVSGQTITAVKTLEVTNAPTSGAVIDPQILASSINFLSTDPADNSIVLAGAGGNGRTETGILKFRVVDKNNTPVKGVLVDFVVNPSSDVILNVVQSTTDADGVVITSVSSKTIATAVVIKATVNGKSITTQSDQLKVTTGLGVQAGFEILPLTYNLDGALSGDSTDVTARLVDSNSNPVADGVPVVLVATGGKIGSSAAGGCNTLNGACTVKFEVQEPRPANGFVTVTGSTKVGASTPLQREITLHMSSAPLAVYEPMIYDPKLPKVGATPLNFPSPIVLTSCNKVNRTYMVANSLGFSAPSGSSIAVKGDLATGFGASIGTDNTILDGTFGPSYFNVLLDPSTSNNPSCNPNGIGSVNASFKVDTYAPKSKRVSKQSIDVTYPAGNLELFNVPTTGDPAAFTALGCNAFIVPVAAVGSDGMTLPAGAEFSISATNGAIATIGNTEMGTFANSTILPVASSSLAPQSLWMRVTAPSAGTALCQAGTGLSASFTVNVTFTNNERANTKKVTVTYPMAKSI